MTTDSRTLYATLLGLKAPWEITDVEMKQPPGEVHIRVALPEGTRWVCPQCGSAAPIHDHQERHWRHLDTCQFPTLVHARVPRLNCPTHGIKQLPVPWAEVGSRFTAMFEVLAIDWLKYASVKAVAAQLRISWAEADGIMQRAVRRGLQRRTLEAPRHAGVDETSFQKRHEYVTVVSDLERGIVLHVADDRGRAALDGFWTRLSDTQRARIEAVAMDMWEPYIQSTRAHLPGADQKIVFDKFHIAQHLGNAVDLVATAGTPCPPRPGRRHPQGNQVPLAREPERPRLVCHPCVQPAASDRGPRRPGVGPAGSGDDAVDPALSGRG